MHTIQIRDDMLKPKITLAITAETTRTLPIPIQALSTYFRPKPNFSKTTGRTSTIVIISNKIKLTYSIKTSPF